MIIQCIICSIYIGYWRETCMIYHTINTHPHTALYAHHIACKHTHTTMHAKHTHTHYLHACTHAHTHARTHARTHTHTHTHTHMHTCTHVHTRTRTHACTHIRTHAHTPGEDSRAVNSPALAVTLQQINTFKLFKWHKTANHLKEYSPPGLRSSTIQLSSAPLKGTQHTLHKVY